jgi:PPK2 family polyphosphate:nucleotide phosphotransferase
MIDSPYLVKPGKSAQLNKRSTSEQGPFRDKEEGELAARGDLEKLVRLQEVLYAEAKHAVLIVLQAMDAGGKDGTIKHVFSGINPQGCHVTKFGPPTPEELAHDFLWKAHGAVPLRGMIGIFNRSHYEYVLVARVRKLVTKKVWSTRFDHINAFERALADEGVTILKFFLHISKEEQKRRLVERMTDPAKNWKFNPDDFVDRDRWDDYMAAYEDALTNCSTPHAPWFVVPADRKWFRNWVISDVVTRTLLALDMQYPQPTPDVAKLMRKMVEQEAG